MGEGTDRLFLQSFESSLLCLSRRMWLTAALVGALIALAVSAFFHPFWMISIASRLYRDIIWLGPSNSKDASSKPRIFLTIDDAPSGPRTNEILAALKKYDAKATFFCIGSHIEQYESEFNQIVASGHSVGNHTMFDRKSIDLTASELDCEIKTTDALIEKGFTKMKVSRPPPHLRFFRPGHGVWNKTLLDITKKVRTNSSRSALKEGLKRDLFPFVRKRLFISFVAKF